MKSTPHRAALILLGVALIGNGSWCFCGATCDSYIDVAAGVTAEASQSNCDCCNHAKDDTQAPECCTSEEEGLCCGCCVERLPAVPTATDTIDARHMPFALSAPHPAHWDILSGYSASTGIAFSCRDSLSSGQLYLRLGVLRI
ncbi:MAG: hypothetical protein QGI24_01030 [Kiritimatiellia bacterium]|nr:hypothetical protein [Kiritimatiellia bacterium]MDP6847344.1 hypothetical protein [Kiritimatiellia bacterium]